MCKDSNELKEYSFNLDESEVAKFDEMAEAINNSFEKLITENAKLQEMACVEKHPKQCRCAFRCFGNEFCNDAEAKINFLKTKIKNIDKYATRLLTQLTQDFKEDDNFSRNLVLSCVENIIQESQGVLMKK